MHEAETVERRAEQRQCVDPGPIATSAVADDHGGEGPPSDSFQTLSLRIATGSGVAVVCVVEGAWLWLLATGAAWLFGGQ
jgi:hypothetical protein